MGHPRPKNEFEKHFIIFQRALLKTTHDLPADEASIVADAFLQLMKLRISTGNQIAAIRRGADDWPGREPHNILRLLHWITESMEITAEKALGYWVEREPVGQWLLSIKGISNRLSAKMLASFRIEIKDEFTGELKRIQTVSAWWRYAGLDPTCDKLVKGQKAPFNAMLRTFIFQVGDSFLKQRTPVYRDWYDIWKKEIQEKNAAGDYAEYAAAQLAKHTYRKDTTSYQAYSMGRLPDGQIDRRARRKMAKLFLSHFHYVWYSLAFNEPPPKPYSFSHLGHAHMIDPPNLHVVGLGTSKVA